MVKVLLCLFFIIISWFYDCFFAGELLLNFRCGRLRRKCWRIFDGFYVLRGRRIKGSVHLR